MNAPYYRWWEEGWRPFTTGKFPAVAMHFSLQYFEKLRRELEAAGAGEEIIMMWTDVLYSPPLGCFFVSDSLKGECFVFLNMCGPWVTT